MRNKSEIMNLILKFANKNEDVRAVTLNGSRANPDALVDVYSDFDIEYYVTDVRKFTLDKEWIRVFGEILIVQCPSDWYDNPYNYHSQDTFVYLMQFADGNRIDLSVVSLSNIDQEKDNTEPRQVLLNKDSFKELTDSSSTQCYKVQIPGEMEFYNTVNEFRWLTLYIMKGILRKEVYYAKYAYDVLLMPMFIKMVDWKIGVQNEFNVNTGTHSKYIKRYLDSKELIQFQSVFPNGEYEDIEQKLMIIYDLFHEYECLVGSHLNYERNVVEQENVKKYLLAQQNKGKK